MQTLAQLKRILRYDPKTGYFHWKTRLTCGNGHEPDDIAGTQVNGYIQIRLARPYRYYAHRLAWWFMTGRRPPRDKEVGHKNTKRADNRWENLHLGTSTVNKQNLNDKLRKNNRSGHRGVLWRTDKKKWRARIVVDKHTIALGDYTHLNEAVAARKQAEKLYY